MSNALYDPGREGILDRTIDMTGDIRAMLVLSTYNFAASHKFIADLGAVDNGRSAALSGKSYTSGVFDASDVGLVATAALACKAIVLFQHTGNDATARLVAYIDTVTSGLPFTPAAGQSGIIGWVHTANKIFKL
jgi:hypothetical protein